MQHLTRRRHVTLSLIVVASAVAALCVAGRFVVEARADEPKITHGFLACGGQTYIMNGAGEIVWRSPRGSRDGYVLPGGNVVLAVSKGGEFPGGAAIEVTRQGVEHVIWKGTQDEVNSVQPVRVTDSPDDAPTYTYVLTEAGPNPRLLEVDRDGKVLVEFPLDCQKANAHMETRMARKLADGSYLAPHLLDFAVKQYDKAGKVLKVFDTKIQGVPKTWPFTAIRLPDGSTFVNLTNGNQAVRYDADGKIIWSVSNEDLAAAGAGLLADPCGGQVLPNGNVVIASYGQRDGSKPKLLEITPDKKVVWTYVNPGVPTVHNFQILDTNGQALPEPPMK